MGSHEGDSDVVLASATRQVFRHSVVPGGISSAEEAEAAVLRDPVVRTHYAGINTRALRVETLPADRMVYMSYRIKDKVYWTSHKVRLPQGEAILTDGKNELRARCGNCISLEPMEPTAANEPDPMEFEALDEGPGLAVLPSRVVPTLLALGPNGEIPFGLLFSTPFSVAEFVPPGAFDANIPFGTVTDPGDPIVQQASNPVPTSSLFLADPGPEMPSENDPPTGTPRSFPGTPPGGNPPAGDPPVGDPPFGDPPGGDPPGGDPPGFPELRSVPSTPVPEPASLLLIGGGIAALAARRRRMSSR